MKFLYALCLAILLSNLQAYATETSTEEKILNIYNWSDYIAEDTIQNFEKEFGIKVRYDNFDSNEVLHAKLMAGRTGYDIVIPSLQWARLQVDADLLQALDKQQLPNLKNLDPILQQKIATVDQGNRYLVNWLWGFVTVGINVSKVKKALGNLPMPENAWDFVFNPHYAARLKSCGISFLDSASEVIPSAMRYIGKPPFSSNVADYDAARNMLRSVRPYITRFSSSGYINDLANGGLCVVLGWSGDINIARQRAIDANNGQTIQTLIPKNGAVLVFDMMAIPKDAPHPKNAHLFINYILRPQVNASLTNKVLYANPNKAAQAFVKKELMNNPSVFLNDQDKEKMIVPQAVNPKTRRVVTRLFTQFKTGQ